MNNKGDQMIMATQSWLNKTYERYVAQGDYSIIDEDGMLGMGTIGALIKALQIELGISPTVANFGPGTETAFKKHGAIKREDGVNDNLFGIVQGALWCKGYDTGHYAIKDGLTGKFIIDDSFDSKVEDAIKKLQKDAGRSTASGEVDLNIMKALLSMDYFVTYKTDAHTRNIRSIQQYLNCNYEKYIGLKPCDGIFQAGTSKALMYGLQAEEGLPVGTANGYFGPTTKKTCPTIPYTQKEKNYNGRNYTNDEILKFTILARMALYVNGFAEPNGFTISGEYNNSLVELINDFQSLYAIPKTGILDAATWASLLVSTGDTSRTATACDTATIITEDNIKVLKDNGIKYIGRYLSGTAAGGVPKGLSAEELQLLFKNGIRVFPIHQGAANKVSYFTTENASKDANSAFNNAERLHLEFGSIIYFAVDCDPVDIQVTNYILPYFKKLHSEFMTLSGGKYRIGVYGPRNICTRVCSAGYACSSFVADMAAGYSGNLGYPIPKNWAFDQFSGATIYSQDKTKSLSIDKDGYSGQNDGIGTEYSIINLDLIEGTSTKVDSTNINDSLKSILINMTKTSVPVYSRKSYYLPPEAQITSYYKTSGEIIGEIKPNDFYIRYAVENPDQDNVHKVMFHDGKNVKIGYITENPCFLNFGKNQKEGNESQQLKGHDLFTCAHYNFDLNKFEIVLSDQDQIFEIKHDMPYFKEGTGEYEGIIKSGSKIKILGNDVNSIGAKYGWRVYVHEIDKTGNNNFEKFGKFIPSGIEFGNDIQNRAWV